MIPRPSATLGGPGQGAHPVGTPRQAEPVCEWGASTGFDSGEPCWRRKIARTVSATIDMNSLCQFWNDSNQNCDVARYPIADTGSPPWTSWSALYSAEPVTAWS